LFVRLSEAPKGGSPIQLFLCLFVLSFYLFVQRPSQQWVGLGSTEPYPAFPLFCFSSFVCVFVQCPSQQWVGLGSTELDSTFPLFYFPELLTDFNGTSSFCKTPSERKIKQKQDTESEWTNVYTTMFNKQRNFLSLLPHLFSTEMKKKANQPSKYTTELHNYRAWPFYFRTEQEANSKVAYYLLWVGMVILLRGWGHSFHFLNS